MGLLSALGAAAGYALAPATGGASLALSAAALGSTIGGSLEAGSAQKSAAQTQSNAANYAADLQRQTALDQMALQRETTGAQTALQQKMYQEGVTRQEPWYAAGKTALSNLQSGLAPGGQYTKTFSPSDLYTDPSYAWRLQQGQKALEQSAAARGIQFSGGTQAALQNYGQQSASTEYQNAYNRFMNDQTNQYNRQANIAGLGQTTASGLAGQGANMASNIGNLAQQGTSNISVYGANMATNVGDLAQQAANAQSAGRIGAYNTQQQQIGQLAGALGQYGPQGNVMTNPYGWGGNLFQSDSVNLAGGGTFAV